MKIFADTSNVEEIEELNKWGVIDGVTTNPKILATEGCKEKDLEERILKIASTVDGPVSVEVKSGIASEMVSQAEVFARLHKNIVIKIPMGVEGLKAVKILTKRGIKTNVTACMSSNQCLMAAKAGATFASIFYGRIGDIGFDGNSVIRDTVSLFSLHNIKTEVIVGSIRTLLDINSAALAGAHIITIPPKFLKQMTEHPQTTAAIKEFDEAWVNANKCQTK